MLHGLSASAELFVLQAGFLFIFLATPTVPTMGIRGHNQVVRVRHKVSRVSSTFGAGLVCTKKFDCTFQVSSKIKMLIRFWCFNLFV